MNEIIIEENNLDEIKLFLQQNIRKFNYQFFGQYELKNFAVYIKNDNEIIAGIYGFVLPKFKTARLEFVYINENYRKKGLGCKLITEAEKYAITKKCNKVQISTFEFQAPEFYEKIGYKQIGVIPKWFGDKDEIFFVKELDIN